MLDDYKETQSLLYNQINKIIKNNKISHAYLIETNGNSYGFSFAVALAKMFLCENNKTNNNNCLNCSICKNIENGNYPDLKIIEATSNVIKKEQVLNLQESFMLKPLYGKYLVYIIKEANLLNTSSGNTILKFLEEPNDNIIAILLTDNIYNCLDTIVSRCQIFSLTNNDNKNIDKIYLKYNNNNDINEFIKEKNELVLSYFSLLEEQKLNYLAYNNPYAIKDELELFLTLALYLYMDVLNVLLNRKITKFINYEDQIIKISSKNKTYDIIKKIDIINQFLQKSKLNVNKDLFIDNFLINFVGGNNND